MPSPYPIPGRLADDLDYLREDVAVILTMAPLVAEHARRGPVAGRQWTPYPTSGRGENLKLGYAEDHADPTGEAAIHQRPEPEHDDVAALLDLARFATQVRDLARQARWLRAVLPA